MFHIKRLQFTGEVETSSLHRVCVSPHLRESEEAGGGQARDEDAGEDDGEGVQRHKLAPPGQMNTILRMVA
jgi:hypothetical protein